MTAPLPAWVGDWTPNAVDTSDDITAGPLNRFMALLNRDATASGDSILPPLTHWLYFLPQDPQARIQSDGHAKRGQLLPPIVQPRRMWAGGRLEFLAPLRIGARAHRRSIVTSVKEKQGKSGALVFVTLRHEISTGGIPAVIEEQDLVFRDAQGAAAPRKADTRVAAVSQPFEVDVTFLFRFSALTFNAHRIHYDRGYATGVEGYEDLVVHGPLQAMLLIDHLCHNQPQASLTRFSYRAEAPLFANQRFELNYQDLSAGEVELWTRDRHGSAGMTARATLA